MLNKIVCRVQPVVWMLLGVIALVKFSVGEDA